MPTSVVALSPFCISPTTSRRETQISPHPPHTTATSPRHRVTTPHSPGTLPSSVSVINVAASPRNMRGTTTSSTTPHVHVHNQLPTDFAPPVLRRASPISHSDPARAFEEKEKEIQIVRKASMVPQTGQTPRHPLTSGTSHRKLPRLLQPATSPRQSGSNSGRLGGESSKRRGSGATDVFNRTITLRLHRACLLGDGAEVSRIVAEQVRS